MSGLARAVAAVCLGLALLGPVAAQQLKMKLASPMSGEAAAEWTKLFKAGVEARAGGRLRVDLLGAGQTGSIPATIDSVAAGSTEIAVVPTASLTGLEPRLQVLDLPGLLVELGHAQRVAEDPEFEKLLARLGAGKGVTLLAVLPLEPTVLVSVKAVRSLADLKGLKLRVVAGTPLHVDSAKALGASPVALPAGEVLQALRSGAIEASMAGLALPIALGHREVAKALTTVPGGVVWAGVLVNARTIKSLGRTLEQTVRDEVVKARAAAAPLSLAAVERAKAGWAQNGGEAIDLPPAEATQYRVTAASVLPPLLAANPALMADYEAVLAIAKRNAP